MRSPQGGPSERGRIPVYVILQP